jgi:AspT/YidE/YbjL antiporter-like protein
MVLSLISAIGLLLGHIRIFGISLGITFVFFAGIMAGHFGIHINAGMLLFAQNFGLILFVYALGLQVGPGFFSSLKKGGLGLNLMGIAVIVFGLLLVLGLHGLFGMGLPTLMGLLSGAVTNTPMLGAAQQALLQLQPDNAQGAADMALACAVGYPFGVVGLIVAIAILHKFCCKPGKEAVEANRPKPDVTEFQVLNPVIFGKSVKEAVRLSGLHFVISRLWHEGQVSLPGSGTILCEGDHLLVVSPHEDVEKIQLLFGGKEDVDWNKEGIDWDAIDKRLISRRIVVTHGRVNGVRLGSLRLRNLYGINITRVNRAGIDLLASPRLRLQIGDRLTIVGETDSVKAVGKILGDEVKQLTIPHLFAVFLGIFLGVFLGSLPIYIPGMATPVKFGIAGGPIIVGILVGAFGPRFHMMTYTTQSASLMVRQLGIVLYLAGLGLSSGAHFFETVFCAEGLVWIGIAILFTIVPVLLVGFWVALRKKADYAANVGMLCGAMANPMALTYANSTAGGDEPAVAYATVYPLSMFLRVITAQLLILLCV